MEYLPEDLLDAFLRPLAYRLAIEGIPIRAIARALNQPSENVRNTLRYGVKVAEIVSMPAEDWPPTARLTDRRPSLNQKLSPDDLAFACRREFRLTHLEAGFLVLLLQHERATKAQLHHVIESRRLQRASGANAVEPTNQKMVDVIICKLRKRLTAVDEAFEIVTVWGDGYYLDEAVRERVMARITEATSDGSAPQG